MNLSTTDTTSLSEFIRESRASIERCNVLTEEMIWSRHGVSLWEADRFTGSPYFYPVYRYKNIYSYSFLNLILYKKNLSLNHRVVKKISAKSCPYLSDNETIDREIERIGGPPSQGFVIKNADEYAQRIASALKEDTSAIENTNPGYTNIILCGGRDSLNLLLLPWKNPVLVASAPPNYELVKEFIANNSLSMDIIPLRDDDESILDIEILINCCRNDLEHCRWGPHLKELSGNLNNKVVFWKGQLGDTFMTPYWKKYMHSRNLFDKICSRISSILCDYERYQHKVFYKSLWYRGAMWQGTHMSIIRQLTDSLVVSGYHGPAMKRVLSEVDLKSAVQEDVRPMVGKYLHGTPVLYPDKNPGPLPSNIRKGISHLEPFLKILSTIGLPYK